MSRALVDVVAARLEAEVPGRVVYKHAVPDNAAPRYLFVYSNTPGRTSDNLGDVATMRDETVWVNSTSIGPREQATAESLWGAEHANAALENWRPPIGSASWRPVPLSSQPPTRDESLPSVTAIYTVSTWGFTYQP